jgi:hypothetical protein
MKMGRYNVYLLNAEERRALVIILHLSLAKFPITTPFRILPAVAGTKTADTFSTNKPFTKKNYGLKETKT